MPTSESESATIRDYLRPIRARWWLIVTIALVAGAGAYLHARGKPASYTAATNLYLQSTSAVDSVLGGASGGSGVPGRDANNQAVLLKTTAVAAEAARRLHFTGDPRALLSLVTVAPSANADFLGITASGATPQGAIDIANAFAKAYIATRTQTAKGQAAAALKAAQTRFNSLPKTVDTAQERATLSDQIQRLQLFQSLPSVGVQQVEPAAGAVRIASSPKKSAIFALALGALLGTMLVFGFEFFDRRVKRYDEVAGVYGRSVLVGIPRAPRSAQHADVSKGLQPPFTEAFRALRTSIQLKATGSATSNGRPLRIILVTSAVPQEGKSTVARNLALAFHEAGLRVTVVDADLRRPQMAKRFGVSMAGGPGLTELLAGEIDVETALRAVEVDSKDRDTMIRVRERASRDSSGPKGAYRASAATLTGEGASSNGHGDLTILPSGRTPPDPAAVLTAGGLEEVLQEIARDHDVVIVDSPPLLVVSDAVPILSMVDGVLLVSRLGLTTTTNVAQLNELLDRVPNVDILGVVANDMRDTGGAYGYVERSPSRTRRRAAA